MCNKGLCLKWLLIICLFCIAGCMSEKEYCVYKLKKQKLPEEEIRQQCSGKMDWQDYPPNE